ncbi:MAG TPA: hypothetical protein VMV19_19705 [Xanthobacteraceae bacterium]|nr:hypothetical protein [Xanthobacteraceae bacterium]
MTASRWTLPALAAALALVALAAPARAETLELSCTMPPPDPPMHISIDLTNHTYRIFCEQHCSTPAPAKITDRTFDLGGIIIDRMTGQVTWATGAPGTCAPLKQRF